MNLETKRNALLNSVASSGLELLETKTITEDTYIINFDVDTSEYNTFIIKGDYVFNQSSNNWIYITVNGNAQETGTNYIGSFSTTTLSIPRIPTSSNDRLVFPIIYTKNLSGKITSNLGNKPIFSLDYENVTQLTLHQYQNGRFSNGTTLELYGMKESLIF